MLLEAKTSTVRALMAAAEAAKLTAAATGAAAGRGHQAAWRQGRHLHCRRREQHLRCGQRVGGAQAIHRCGLAPKTGKRSAA